MNNDDRISALEAEVASLKETLDNILDILPVNRDGKPKTLSDEEFIDGLDTMTRFLLERGDYTLEQLKAQAE